MCLPLCGGRRWARPRRPFLKWRSFWETWTPFLTQKGNASAGVLVRTSIDWTSVISIRAVAVLCCSWFAFQCNAGATLLGNRNGSADPSTSKSGTDGHKRKKDKNRKRSKRTNTHLTPTLTLSFRHYHHILLKKTSHKPFRSNLNGIHSKHA